MDITTQLHADPKTILVVDDELSVLTVVKCMLEFGNYNVLLASNPEVALRIASNYEVAVDLLITDVIMPDMHGPDLAKAILDLRPELQVLFISGYADSDVVRIEVLNHSLSFLPKPFTPDGLLATVGRLLDTRGSRMFAAACDAVS